MLICVSTRSFTPRRLEDTTNPVTTPDDKDAVQRVEETLELLHFLGDTIKRLTHDNYDVLHRLTYATRDVKDEIRTRADEFYQKFHHEVNKYGDYIE